RCSLQSFSDEAIEGRHCIVEQAVLEIMTAARADDTSERLESRSAEQRVVERVPAEIEHAARARARRQLRRSVGNVFWKHDPAGLGRLGDTIEMPGRHLHV